MNSLISLFKFATRLPIKVSADRGPEKIGRAIEYFPVVGIVIGIIMYAFYMFFMRFCSMSPLLLTGVMLVVYIVIAGEIHIKGLVETFDSVFSYRSKQKMLERIKENSIGVNGALTIGLYLTLNVLLFAELYMKNLPVGAIILLYPVVGRFCYVLNCFVSGKNNLSGNAKLFVENVSKTGIVVSVIITILYSIIVLTYFGMMIEILWGIVAVVILAYIFGRIINRKIGGVTDETLSATLEMSQVFFLLFVSICK